MGQRCGTVTGARVGSAGVAVFGLLALLFACGDDIGSKKAGEPCTRSDQCMQGLECMDGVCRSSDAGAVD